MKAIDQTQFHLLVSAVKEKILEARLTAFQAVNKTLIELYWNIGQIIVERQKEHGWSKSVVETLSKELKKAFPTEKGFSSRNLWNMRDFLH